MKEREVTKEELAAKINSSLDDLVPLVKTEGTLYYILRELCRNVRAAEGVDSASVYAVVAKLENELLDNMMFRNNSQAEDIAAIVKALGGLN